MYGSGLAPLPPLGACTRPRTCVGRGTLTSVVLTSVGPIAGITLPRGCCLFDVPCARSRGEGWTERLALYPIHRTRGPISCCCWCLPSPPPRCRKRHGAMGFLFLFLSGTRRMELLNVNSISFLVDDVHGGRILRVADSPVTTSAPVVDPAWGGPC